MVLCRADSAFRTVWILDIGGDKLPLQLHFSSQIEKWLAALIVHPDSVNGYTMSSKKLDSSPQRGSCVFRSKADKGLDINIPPITKETRARSAGFR